jgi:cyclopropane-fatty-acyl-phospholipid synthase
MLAPFGVFSPDLTALIELALLNEDSLSHAFFGKWIAGLGNFVRHFMSRNTKTGSRRNITYHYDLGNDFYSEWLDKSMTYSSALFEHEGQSLIEAQENKYRHIARLADVKENDRVLEIGCGWGGFAEVAAKDFGVRVKGITLSDEQLAFAQNRIKEQGLEDQAQFHLRDYRDQQGRFDAIVSIEMFEAVGQENWDTYFQTLRRNLKENGKAIVQVITIDEGRFDKYRKTVDFIQRYIFPGGLLPSKAAFIEAASRNGLTAKMTTEFGGDYAETLRLWREEFHAKWETIAKLGFDERFKRMWEFYLQYCEAGFRQKSIDVAIFELK